jgi:hypothetical protein
MIVTPLPPLPFVSRPTRTTVDLLGSSGLQVHVVLSWWHLGQRSFRQPSFPIVESPFLLADLRHNPSLFHLLPQLSELGCRLAGRLAFVGHYSILLSQSEKYFSGFKVEHL